MRQPEGFQDPRYPNHVCKLVKALYGLKKAPRTWFDRLRFTLLQWGFKNAKSDVSLFYLHNSKLTIYILIYVDDILVTGNDPNYLSDFIQRLNSVFALKALYYFLGIEVYRDSSGMYLNQAKYAQDVLKRFKMSGCASTPTPMVTGRKFSKLDGKFMTNPSLYRSAIGSLHYLTTTGLDISFSVNKLSQFLEQPTETHFQGAKRIMRYLKGTLNLSLHIQPAKALHVVA